jgi:ubiquinone biosynthesis protein COQ9
VQWYSKQLALIMAIIFAVNLVLLYFIKNTTNAYIETFGFQAPDEINQYVILGSLILISALWLVQYISIRRQIYKLV